MLTNLPVEEQKEDSIGRNTCNGIVSSSVRRTGICSGVLTRVAKISYTNLTLLRGQSYIALVATGSASSVSRKIMHPPHVNKSKSGSLRNKLNQKT